MDLLGDLGTADQLTSAREENKVLAAKVRELKERVAVLSLENQSLLAEVEEYRREALGGRAAGGGETKEEEEEVGGSKGGGGGIGGIGHGDGDDFVVSGDGVYPTEAAVTLPSLHGPSNPLCCALRPGDDALLATGGADGRVRICRWGAGLAPTGGAMAAAAAGAASVRLGAPVLSVAFSPAQPSSHPLLAAGGMDGEVRLIEYGAAIGVGRGGGDGGGSGGPMGGRILDLEGEEGEEEEAAGRGGGGGGPPSIKHAKYVKAVAFSPDGKLLASASADGTVRLTRVHGRDPGGEEGDGGGAVRVGTDRTLHLAGPVEAVCFLDGGDTLCCYARDTSYLSYFDLSDGAKQTRVSVNEGECRSVGRLVSSSSGSSRGRSSIGSRPLVCSCFVCLPLSLFFLPSIFIFIFPPPPLLPPQPTPSGASRITSPSPSSAWPRPPTAGTWPLPRTRRATSCSRPEPPGRCATCTATRTITTPIPGSPGRGAGSTCWATPRTATPSASGTWRRAP